MAACQVRPQWAGPHPRLHTPACRPRHLAVCMDLLIDGAKELGLELDAGQVGQFELYYREMLDGNSRMSLTRVIDPEEVQTRHFVDSLSVTAAVPDGALRAGAAIMDVGSGGGLPGVPLKIAYPKTFAALLRGEREEGRLLGAAGRGIGPSWNQRRSWTRRGGRASFRSARELRRGSVPCGCPARHSRRADPALLPCRRGWSSPRKGPYVHAEV